MAHQTILVLDFGSQYTQLIARRLRELHVFSEILPPTTSAADLAARNPVGIILSGGPRSVSDPGAPTVDPGLFDLGTPTLGICYGMQLMTHALGGRVEPATSREYGHAVVSTQPEGRLFKDVKESLKVWASHGDFVAAAPPGFSVVATSPNAPVAAIQRPERQQFGLLFHPEVVHTEQGEQILRNCAYDICGCRGDWTMASFVDESVARIQEKVLPLVKDIPFRWCGPHCRRPHGAQSRVCGFGCRGAWRAPAPSAVHTFPPGRTVPPGLWD